MPETKTRKRTPKFKPPKNEITSVRIVDVPESLIGASSTKIRAWAREMLNGQEAKFRNGNTSKGKRFPSDFERISKGEIKKFELRPVRPGFIASDGTFVEAMNDSLSSAEDLGKSNEVLCHWIDEENKRFDKPTTKAAESSVYELWKHGKRISEFVKESGIPYKTVKAMFEKRSSLDKHYDHNARDIAIILYQWKPEGKIEEPVFHWTWGIVYALCRTRDAEVRSYWENLIATQLVPNKVSNANITALLRQPNKNHDIWNGDHAEELEKMRSKILNKEKLSEKETQKLVEWLKPKTEE